MSLNEIKNLIKKFMSVNKLYSLDKLMTIDIAEEFFEFKEKEYN